MTEKLENLTKKFESLKIALKKFEIWNNLPEEMKLECIKTLDFKTKWNLRQTSKTERALVDSKKVKIDEGSLEANENSLQSPPLPLIGPGCYTLKFNGETYKMKLRPKPTPFFDFILAHVDFEKLNVSINCTTPRFQKVVVSKFSVKNVEISGFLLKMNIKMFMEDMKNQPESLKLDNWGGVVPFDHLISSPKIVNVRFLQVTDLKEIDTAHKLAQIWIENDAEVGKNYQALISKKGSFETFSQKFSDRIVSKTDKSVRIRTDNPSKHILLELGTSQYESEFFPYEYFRMTMIPAEMKESEIDKNKQWVCDLEKKLPP